MNMTNLDCTVINCAYNKDRSCSRNDISVEGNNAILPSETSCGSFKPKTSDKVDNSCHCVKKETDVSCEAVECKYNASYKCSAKHIGIAGGHADNSSETECSSFER